MNRTNITPATYAEGYCPVCVEGADGYCDETCELAPTPADWAPVTYYRTETTHPTTQRATVLA